jgi:hypothetical protein
MLCRALRLAAAAAAGAAVSAAVAAAPAGASDPRTPVPGRELGAVSRPPTAQALRRVGLRVAWPAVGAGVVEGGRRLVVGVTPTGRRRPLARVTLVRVRADGRLGRTHVRRTLRRGRVVMWVPMGAERRYVLRLQVGRRLWWSHLRVPVVPGPPGCPAAGVTAAGLRVEPAAGRVGDHLTLTLHNTGDTCLWGGWDYRWERRLPDGSWQPVEGSYPVPAIAVETLPGQTSSHGAFVWPELRPGPHRLVKVLAGPDGARVAPAAPFEVLP